MKKHLILASQSPRRREMVSWLNLSVIPAKADINETPIPDETPQQLAGRLAAEKAIEVKRKYEDGLILAADTIVDFDHHILGKPSSGPVAVAILKQLRNEKHQVHTAVSLLQPGKNDPVTLIVTTDVWMRPYSDDEINTYVSSGDPMDKAGAYAIQHRGFHPVHRVNRCYANVVGFPICAVMRLLAAHYTLSDINPFQLCQNHFDYRCPGKDKGVYL